MTIHFDNVPFYSQFQDISRPEWRGQSCGIASMAMAIEFYKPKSFSITKLLSQAINSGAYDPAVGWKHQQLAELADRYGLVGTNYDFSEADNETALNNLEAALKEGPVVVSIHNKFDPRATLGHIVVLTGFENEFMLYNDPASAKVEKKISTLDFLKGWKKRFITVREKAPADAPIALDTRDFTALP